MPASTTCCAFCVAFIVAINLTTADAAAAGTDTRAPTAEYVAMGSSFASGPGIASEAVDGLPQCWQSAANYARLVARKLGLSLVDNTCAGATTADILNGGQHGYAPQVAAITAETRLVTVTIGGNDIGYLSNLAAWSCARKPEVLPSELRDLACNAGRSDEAVAAGLARLGSQFDRIAEEVHRRSPRAHLVFVDYTTVLPASGACPDRLPISEVELQRGRAIAAGLENATAQGAARNGALLVKASDVTRGHDVCSSDPWVSGWVFPPTLKTWAPGAYHPTSEAMKAIADAIVAQHDTD